MSSVIYPNYIILPENKYIYKNIQKKQKIIDDQQEIEGNKEESDLNKQILSGEGDVSKETILTSKVIDSILNQTDTSQNKKFFDVSEQSIVEDLKITQIVQAIEEEDKKSNNSSNKNNKNNTSKINKVVKSQKKTKLNSNNKSKTSRNVYNKKIISNIENEVNINKNKKSKNKENAIKNTKHKIISRNKINSLLNQNSRTNSNTMNDFYSYNLDTNANTNNNNNCKKEFFKTINTKFTNDLLSKINYEKENETENNEIKKQNVNKRKNKTSAKKYLVNILFNEKNLTNQIHNKDLKTARLIDKNNVQKDKVNKKRELSNNSVNRKNSKIKTSVTHISHKLHNLKQISGMNNTINNEIANNINNNRTYISKHKTPDIVNNNIYPSKNAQFLFNKKKIKSRNNTDFTEISPNTLTESKDLNSCYYLNNANTVGNTYTVNKSINNTINNTINNNNNIYINNNNNNTTIGFNKHKIDNVISVDNNSVFNKTPRTFYHITDTNSNIRYTTGNKRILYKKIISNNYANKNAQKKNSNNNFWTNENNVPLSARDNREKKIIQEMYEIKKENDNNNKLKFNKNEIPSNIIRKKYAFKYNPVNLNYYNDQNNHIKIGENRINNTNDFDSDLSNLTSKMDGYDKYKQKTSVLLKNLNINQLIPRIKTSSSTLDYEDKNQINYNRINNQAINTQINYNDINYYSKTVNNDNNNKMQFRREKKKSDIIIDNYQQNYYNDKFNIDDDNNKVNREKNREAFQKHSKIKSTQLSSAANLNINFNNYNTNVFFNKNEAMNENGLYNTNKIFNVKNDVKKKILPLHIKGFDKLIIKKDNKKHVFKPITYRDRVNQNNKFSSKINGFDQS